MGWLDSLLGRSKPAQPDLDTLFALPTAAVTMQIELGFTATGTGAVCYKAAAGQGFAQAQAELTAVLDADEGPKVEISQDSYGFTWLQAQGPPEDLATLATDLHAVNATLADAGFGPTLLCSLVPFRDSGGRRLALVYLYKQGTWYPFAPTTVSGASERGTSEDRERTVNAANTRDNTLELQAKGVLEKDLKIEPDLGRWFGVWGAPGLSDTPPGTP